jgi:hypothetical protein
VDETYIKVGGTWTDSQTAGNSQKEPKGAFAFYIGIDLGDKHSDVCVLDSAGEVSQRFR